MAVRKILPLRHLKTIPTWLGRAKNPAVRRTYGVVRTAVRRVANAVTPLQIGWVGVLRTAHWLDDATFEISGWAYERGMDFTREAPRIRVRLRSFGQPDIEAQVTRVDEPQANTGVKDIQLDYTPAGFVARFDLSDLIRLGRLQRRTWRVVISVSGGGRAMTGTLVRRTRFGSAEHLFSRTFEGIQVLPRWAKGPGLSFEVARPAALATTCTVQERRVSADLTLSGIRFSHAEMVSPQATVPMTSTALPGGRVRVEAVLPPIDPAGATSLLDPEEDEGMFSPEFGEATRPVLSVRLDVVDARGGRHQVASVLDQSWELEPPDQLPLPYPGPDGTLRLRDTEAMLLVTEVDVETGAEPRVRVRGRALGDARNGIELALIGPRARRPLSLAIEPDGTFEAVGAWLGSQWGQPASPPPLGQYPLRAGGPDGRWLRVAAAPGMVADVPRVVDFDELGFRCLIGLGGGRRLVLVIQTLLRPQETGPVKQMELARRYQSPDTPIVDQFYFEAFGGAAATCNPLALDREVARRLPEARRIWGVTNASVVVPEGAIKVVRGTEAWWRARETSRYVIVNEWLTRPGMGKTTLGKRNYMRMPGQIVLQTWHGTMFKRIGLDRHTTDLVVRRVLLAERDNWSLLLSQNPHSTEIFRRAYEYDGPIWEEGYPRNDSLHTGDRQAIRRKLGIGDDEIAVLYAPTWRENRTEMVTFLELERLMADLGAGYRLLLRGHSRTKKFGADVHLPGVLDVTSYPNIADLYLAADALITDYSSVMFDFSVTGRPMMFFVPDIEEYRGELRGVYFDLAEAAPGPLLHTQDEVVAAVTTIEQDAPLYAEKYRAWQERFNSHDDGRSAERVIDRLLAME